MKKDVVVCVYYWSLNPLPLNQRNTQRVLCSGVLTFGPFAFPLLCGKSQNDVIMAGAFLGKGKVLVTGQPGLVENIGGKIKQSKKVKNKLIAELQETL